MLEALRREGGLLGGEQSGHIIYLQDHVTGDGLASALLLCQAARGKPLSETVAVMPKFPQVMRNIRSDVGMPDSVVEETERLNAELDGDCRVLVRALRHRACRARPRRGGDAGAGRRSRAPRAEEIVRAALADA